MSHNPTDFVNTGSGCPSSTSFSTDGVLSHSSVNLVLLGVGPDAVGDEGGWEIVLNGIFPGGISYYVSVFKSSDTDFIPQLCYSGIVGDGDLCKPQQGNTQLKCWVPPLPIFNSYDLKVTSHDGSKTANLLGQLNVIHRSFTSNLYDLRSQWPPPRDVGPSTIDEED